MPQPPQKDDSKSSPWIIILMLVMLVVPASITLLTVKSPGTLQILTADPTPRGYTLSLLLFLVPIGVIAVWFLRHKRVRVPRRAFWRTIAIVAPLGCALDFFFAKWFFVFPNAGATLGISAPVLGGSVPIEEYIFYVTGFLAVLLIYVWLDEYWLAAYNVPDYAGEAKQIRQLVRFHPLSLVAGALLVLGAVIFKKSLSHHPEGMPNYFIILVIGGLIPAVGFYPAAKKFINWRALSLTMFIILLVSLVWEATLAVPYGWWGYQPNQMIGIFIGGWSRLPIEAVCVWMAVTYGTIIIFEIVKLWQASNKSFRHAFLGGKNQE